ncbi:bifunctional epoxide hydrolase 2-like isoform X1 [Carex littledalei]|uniref:Bifunctional epoxide hydrolase 2-like isoform X1 n=1 Tax=Carex littledalei TaxID=544730 RepID=A0A833QZJ3_9POAL|nr:bifunctional epoxide hydrolase 2-like isoform X1 [Carex littledalei]
MDESGIKHKMFQGSIFFWAKGEPGPRPWFRPCMWRRKARARWCCCYMASQSSGTGGGDIVALMDDLEQPQVFVVGHDWGAILAWYLCMFRPDRVKALVNMSVPFIPRIASIKPVQFLTAMYGDAYYICRFQEPGVAEAEIERLGVETFLKKIFTYHKPEPFYISKEGTGSPNEKITLPYWITEEEISYYAKSFEKTGFTGPLNYYRCLDLSWDLMAPWSGAEITVPTKFIIGDHDMTYHFPGIQMYINLHGMKMFVPGL